MVRFAGTLVVAVLLYVFVSLEQSEALLPTSPLPAKQIIGAWGMNKAGDYGLTAEKSLLSVCQTESYDIIHISKVNAHFAVNRLPSTQFSIHCTQVYPGLTAPADKIVLNYCPDIGSQIKQCQQLGKKVMLTIESSISGKGLTSDADGVESATSIWNIFLGGSSSFRTFGDAVLDGVEVIALDGITGYGAFVNKLSSLMAADSAKTYYISAGPRCAYPDGYLGPLWDKTVLKDYPNKVDYLTLYYIASDCSWRNVDLFWKAINQWSTFAGATPNMRLFAGLPTSDYVGAAGDYLSASDYVNKSVITKFNQVPNFSGVLLLDVSFDMDTPVCEAEGSTPRRNLNKLIKELFTASASNATVQCTPVKNSSRTGGAPSLSPNSMLQVAATVLIIKLVAVFFRV